MAGGTRDSRNAGTNSIQLGNQARAAGQNSIAFGAGARVTGENTEESILTRAKNNGVAIGYSATAAGFNTTVLGAAAKAQGDNATALGQGTLVTADNSVALGAGSRVTTDDIRDSDTNGVVSVGKSDGERRIINVADGVNDSDAATFGQVKDVQANVEALDALAVQYDSAAKSQITFEGTNGTALSNVSDIVMNVKNPINKKTEQHSFQNAGLLPGKVEGTATNGKWNMAIGEGSEVAVDGGTGADMQFNTAIGNSAGVSQNIVNGDYVDVERSTAIGHAAKVSASNSTAIGDSSNAGEDNSVAIGQKAEVQSATSIAIGQGTKIGGNAENSIAIGTSANQYSVGSKAKNSTVVGVNAWSMAEGGTVLGKSAKIQGSAANGTAIGTNATINVSAGSGNVALGADSTVSKADVGDDTEHGVVSVGQSGDKGFNRRIINVADGVNDSDAATVKQVKAVQGDVEELNKLAVTYTDNTKKAVNFNGATLKNVGDIQIGNAQSTFAGSGLINGKVYNTEAGQWAENGANATHSMAVGSKSSVRGTDSVAVGPEAAVNNGNAGVLEQSTAVGSKATVTSSFSTALGANTQATGDYSVAIGAQSRATGANATAIGAYAAAGENSVVVGGGEGLAAPTVSKANSTAMGTYVDIKSDNGTALGYGSQIGWNGKNSVALGADSVANEENVVSVGHTKGQANGFGGTYGEDLNRRITNVADGKNANDAATVGQISKITGMDSEKGNVVQYDGEDKSVVTFAGANGTKLTNLADGEFKTGSTDAVTAGQLYAAGITPGDTRGNAGSVAMGGGYNNYVLGNNGTAIGYNALANKNAVAIGNSAGAGHLNATAVGQNSNAMEEGATALGQQAWAEVANSTAIGYHADVEYKGDNSVALGANSIVATEDILDTDTAGVVSVGSSGHAFNSTEFNRRIINVADGVNDSDAATYGQVKDVQSSVTALDNLAVKYDTADKTSVTFNRDNKAGSVLNNVNDIVMQVETYNTSGKVSGYKSLSFKEAGIIPGTVSGDDNTDSVVIGRDSKSSKKHSVVVGDGARTLGMNATAIGTGASAEMDSSVAIGSGSQVGTPSAVNGTAVGAGSKVTAKNGTAVGQGAFAWGTDSTVLGASARVERNADGSVALGKDSYAKASDILDSDTKGVVSVGKSGNNGFTRRIINVADGVNDSDAATVKQVKAVQGDVDELNKLAVTYTDNTKKAVNFNGATLKNVGDIQIGNAQSTFAGSGLINGKVYNTEAGQWAENGANATHSMAVGSKSSVRGTDSVAVGPEATVNNGNSVVLEQSTAVGSKATVTSSFSTALGANTQAKGDYSVAVGAQSQTTGANATAIGAYAAAGENSVVVGGGEGLAAPIVSKANSTAMGTYVGIKSENGTALGYGSQVGWNGKNSVALGADSVANEENVVSVGHTKGQTNGFGGTYGEDLNRRITNVANGINDNDAATVGQIKTITGIDSAKGNVVQYDNETKDQITFGGADGTALLNISKLSAKTATIGHVSFTDDGRITNVTAGVNDSDVATVGQIKNLTGLDSAQGNVVQYDKKGNLNVSVGDSGLKVDDTASSISHGDNSISVGADGTTVTGDLNVTGDLTFNGETVSSDDLANAANVAGDVSDIKEQIGAGADGKLGLTNEQTTLVGGINANTEAINGVKTIVGDGKLDNGAADLTAGINANSAAIEQNRNAIGALGSRVSDLGEEVDSVGAISAALAGLHPLDYNGTGSKFQISAALGTYDGTQAAAIGGFYHFNRDTLLSIGGSTSFEGDRKTAANVGVTFRVGEGASEAPAVQDNETKQQMEAMKQEIEMLKAELEQLKNKDTEGTNDKN